MKKLILTIGTLALLAGIITVSWAGTVVYDLSGIEAGKPAVAADVTNAFGGVKTAVDDNHTRLTAIETCPSDMVKVGPICVDIYEASVWDAAGVTQFNTLGGGADNYPCLNTGNDCSVGAANPIYARSMAGVLPSVHITWFQAQQACANVGKRLLTNAEWQMAAAGTPDDGTCAINATGQTGALAGCVSNWGVHDMVGNKHEWVADWMQGNATPWAPSLAAGTTNQGAYGNDTMAGVNTTIGNGAANMPAAIFRGGQAGGTAAGVFSFAATAQPSHQGDAIGFRCAK